jgi:FAD/FMN-containing dehydrogenase
LLTALSYQSMSSLMTPFWTNQTCDPFASREIPCSIGNFNEYTVDAETESDVVATLTFAREKNIRFIIRNTGHDFWGRSIGHGGLTVRMANFKDNELLEWDDAGFYTGPAFKLGAGMMGSEAQSVLEKAGYVMVSGYCSTVGPAGGYVQGGGHSPLGSVYGMAADQTLEYKVITAEGELITVNRNRYSALFWALNGGGAGTWGVIVSMTVRVYPSLPMAGAQFFIDPSSVSQDIFWAIIDKFYSFIPSLTDQGAYITYAFASTHLVLHPVSAYNKTSDQLREMLEPFITYLTDNSVPAFIQFNDAATYLEHAALNFAESMPMNEYPSGGRIIPRDVLVSNTRRAALISALRRIAGAGMSISSTSVRPVQRTRNPTAVHHAWRNADSLVIINTPWQNGNAEANSANVERLTALAPLLLEVAPDSGSYSNEADPFMKEWRHEMYGDHWSRLLDVKERYDPQGFFYSHHTPGADKWQLDGSGRLCKSAGVSKVYI